MSGQQSAHGRTEVPTLDCPEPGDLDHIIRPRAGGGREAVPSYWGLIPSWSANRSVASRTYNARAETLMERAAFRPLLARHRCIIPASGFFESVKGKKQLAVYLTRQDGQPLALAGLWTAWREPTNGELVTSHTVITTEASEEMRRWHHRMPVILDGDRLARWLDPTLTNPAEVLPLLVPTPDGTLTARWVSPDVTNARNDGEQLAMSL
jgi:putative SOS response-associated peptidase YedK